MRGYVYFHTDTLILSLTLTITLALTHLLFLNSHCLTVSLSFFFVAPSESGPRSRARATGRHAVRRARHVLSAKLRQKSRRQTNAAGTHRKKKKTKHFRNKLRVSHGQKKTGKNVFSPNCFRLFSALPCAQADLEKNSFLLRHGLCSRADFIVPAHPRSAVSRHCAGGNSLFRLV